MSFEKKREERRGVCPTKHTVPKKKKNREISLKKEEKKRKTGEKNEKGVVTEMALRTRKKRAERNGGCA